ncbi:MAG: c-type cytochrome [Thermaceae bacterium]
MGWIETTVAALFLVVVLTLWLSRGAGWLELRFWRNAAVISSLVMSGILVYLTIDSLNQIREGSARVPAFSTINREITLRYDPVKHRDTPVLGESTGFLGRIWTEEEAAQLVNTGKLTLQSRDCMSCHTLLGNGAYFAPDLTRAWLDPKWETMIKGMTGKATKEEAMVEWLMHPDRYPTFVRRMPNLRLTEEEAQALVAFLKWMSAIDTNGFPARFLAEE